MRRESAPTLVFRASMRSRLYLVLACAVVGAGGFLVGSDSVSCSGSDWICTRSQALGTLAIVGSVVCLGLGALVIASTALHRPRLVINEEGIEVAPLGLVTRRRLSWAEIIAIARPVQARRYRYVVVAARTPYGTRSERIVTTGLAAPPSAVEAAIYEYYQRSRRPADLTNDR